MSIFSSLVAQSYIAYCENMPNHRGRHRIAKTLDKIFNSFEVEDSLGQKLEIYLSSSMDLSYFGKEGVKSHSPILKAVETLTEGDVFIDVGANIGFFSLYASRLIGESGRVLSFEPSQREFRRLLSNIESNKRSNILPYNLALSDKVGDAYFSISRKSHTGINSLNKRTSRTDHTAIVPTCKGDLFINPFIEKADNCVIKVDVEGAEFLALSGMSSCLKSKNISLVVVEITPDFLSQFNHAKQDIYELMEDCGFVPTMVSSHSEWQYDEVFVR